MNVTVRNRQEPNVREVEADMLVFAVTSSIDALRVAMRSDDNRQLLKQELHQLSEARTDLSQVISALQQTKTK